MKLESLLEDISSINESRTEKIKNATELFKECSRKYMKGITAVRPYPNIKIQSYRGRWGAYDPNKNTILLHADLFTTPKALRSVVFHECIHFWDFDYEESGFKQDTGHGKFFKQKMKEINSKEGSGFISIKASADIIDTTSKPFYVFYFKNGNDYSMFWAKKDDPKIHHHMIRIIGDRAKEYFVIKTNLPVLQVGDSMTVGSKKLGSYVIDKGSKEHDAITNLEAKSYSTERQLKTNPFFVYYYINNNKITAFWSKKDTVALRNAIIIMSKFSNVDDAFILKTDSVLAQVGNEVRGGNPTLKGYIVKPNSKPSVAILSSTAERI